MANHVEPFADSVTFTVGNLEVTKKSISAMDNNTYLISAPDGVNVLIDAADCASAILRLLGKRKLNAVITTHRHQDHLMALAEIVEATDAIPIAGRWDADAIETATGVRCKKVWTKDKLTFGAIDLDVIGLVGHTPGSIALALGTKHIFTGDSLFPGGLGKTNSARDFDSLFTDVKTLVFDRFDDDTQIHPGHGDDTTLGAERGNLAEWRARGW